MWGTIRGLAAVARAQISVDLTLCCRSGSSRLPADVNFSAAAGGPLSDCGIEMDNRLLRAGGRAAILLSAVLLVVALSNGYTALAATAARLSGTFNVTQLVTAAQNGDQVGLSETLPYDFTPECRSGSCVTQMTRQHTDGTNLTYAVIPDSADDYAGNSSYVASCYSNGSVVVQNGEKYNETIKITPTASADGHITAFTGTLSLSFTPTSVGTTDGCLAGSETVQLAGTLLTNTMTVAPGSAVVPWVASVNSNARLQLDLTKDGKDPFCPQGTSKTCTPGPTSTLSYAYFAKTTTFALKLKNLSTGKTCDSSSTQAARVTTIQPAGSDPIGYQVAFDANCGKIGSPDYTGIVADLFVMDSSFQHNYSAPSGGGSQGTDHLVSTLKAYAQINGFACLGSKVVKDVNDLLSISDYDELIADINSDEFAEKLAEIKAEDYEDLSTKPIPGTTSCAAQKIFAQAAVAIHAEAIAAQHNGANLSLNDQIIFNGKHSSYQLFLADPAGVGPHAGSAFTIINVTGSEEDLMLVRAILAGLARTGLIAT